MTLASFSLAQILRLQPALWTFFLFVLTSTAQKKQCTWRSLLHYKWHTVVAVFIFTVYNFAYQNQKRSLVMLNWSVTHWHVTALTVPSFAKFTAVFKKNNKCQWNEEDSLLLLRAFCRRFQTEGSKQAGIHRVLLVNNHLQTLHWSAGWKLKSWYWA